ncbi:hypothetical protein FHL15_008117 [Xylaria flabelliformis]|uniref:MalT-like TPR region domain-containing protein n=1 Tax=Xylaria flabelliformis TaxID=2512241 RepID=A0A553HSI2_9PEZI|nr:hypothetical protein FHL15_008117 [Xylaria flabelliformis]
MSHIYSDGMFSKAFIPPEKPIRISNLEESIRSKIEALIEIPYSDLRFKIFIGLLHSYYNQRYCATKEVTDLDAIIDYARAFVNLFPTDKPRRAGRLNKLGVYLEERYTRTRRIEDLQEAIAVLQEAVQLAQGEDGSLINPSIQVRNLHDLGVLLGRKYLVAGDTADFNMAKESLELAFRIEVNLQTKAKCLMSLSHRYADRYFKEGTEEYIRDSIDLLVQVAIWVPESNNDADYLHILAIRHADRALLSGSTLALDNAILSAGKAVDLKPGSSSERASYLNTFARTIGLRSIRSGIMGDLDKAIQAAREGLDMTPQDHPNRITYLSGLKMWLGHRYHAQGAMLDLEDSVDLAREIVDLTPTEGRSIADPTSHTRLADLGLLAFELIRRSQSSG